MELKTYQKQVIDNLQEYFDYLHQTSDAEKAFNSFWENKAGQYNPLTGDGMRPYQHTVPNAIHLSIKVPTAGGKTFIACNALKTIFDALPINAKAVVWLVPWSNLLDQTVRNLSNPDHPYCQKLNSLFNNRVQIYQKKDLLQGAGFNPSSVKEQLSIMVMNFASIRAKNKDDRKIFENNGNLVTFSEANTNDQHVLEGSDETSLINVIRSLNPILIVDESHNAESDLSVEMLNNLNPSFILDLTATPKQNANLISLVSAIELKKEHMVKLPVVVYNHQNIEGVIESALYLQKKLEDEAILLEKAGGKYIRPIVLFQAQPKGKEDQTTFDKLKHQLIEIGIPEEQIKIKTANKDELKNTDLMSRDCPVRYIITINALKEGWDCPFAYILASLADRSSEVDVTQILGRVLRQPYVMRHDNVMLNLSYVITASIKFQHTLQNIIKGLQDSGFSELDYRDQDTMTDAFRNELKKEIPDQNQSPNQVKQELVEFDTQKISLPTAVHMPVFQAKIAAFEAMAIDQHQKFQAQIANYDQGNPVTLNFSEVGIKVKQYRMREKVAEQAQKIVLPKFVIETPQNDFLLMSEGGTELLGRTNLLDHFKLSDKDIQIPFYSSSLELYKIDTEASYGGDYTMKSSKLVHGTTEEGQASAYLIAKPTEGQIKDLAYFLIKNLDKMPPIAEYEIKKYVYRILENMSPQELTSFASYKLAYADLVKKKINDLADESAESTFNEWIEIDKIKTQAVWKFPLAIVPNRIGSDIANSLYAHEGEMNSLEEQFIREVASLSNISFWHRNLGRGKGFSLNGYKSNHYPDFILVTKTNKVILIETKGADRDNSDSAAKLRLGKAWSRLSGPGFNYLMVFDKNEIEGAYSLTKAVSLIKQM